MNLTLKAKAALVTTLVVLASVSLAGGWLVEQQARGHTALLRQQQDALADALAAAIDERIETHRRMLVQAARSIDEAALADAPAAGRALARQALRPPFDSLLLAQADGLVLANEPPAAHQFHVGDRDHFRQARVTGQPVISEPLLSRANGAPIVRMLVPLFDARQRFVGALGGGLELPRDTLLGTLGRTRVGHAGRVELVTRGRVPVFVMHPDPDRLMRPAEPITTLDDTDARADFVTRRALRAVPWELRIVLPADEAHAPLLRSRHALWLALALSGIATALAVSAGVGWLMRPLDTLWQAMRRQRESPDERVPIDTRAQDERGRLAREFDALMRQLLAQRAELAGVADTSPLGLFRAGLDGRLGYVNEAYLRIHGFEHREQATEGWISLLPEADRPAARDGWRRAMNEPVGVRLTRHLRRADGREIVVVVRSAPLMVAGMLQGHVGTVADITDRIEGERALRTLATIFDATTDYVVQTDLHGGLTFANPAARRVLGLPADAPLTGMNVLALLPPETVARHAVEILPVALQKGTWSGETVLRDAAGRELRASHLVIAHRDARGRPEYFSAILRDITAEREVQQALHRGEAVLRAVTEGLSVAISVFDRGQRCLFVNQAFETKMGRPRHALLGQDLAHIFGADEAEARRPWVERALAGERVQFERALSLPGGERHAQIELIPLLDAGARVEGFVSVASDISATRAEQQRLRTLADTDALTGVLNRHGLDHALAARAQRARDSAAAGQETGAVALLFVDLDRFKAVNDLHGHATGDLLLRQFAGRLRDLVRPTDTVARLGGDEFLVVLDRVREPVHARGVADKIVEAAGLPFVLPDGRQARIGASVGVAFWRPADTPWEQALEQADAMLYRAKAGGRGQVAEPGADGAAGGRAA
ncbi:PAS domain S-box protein [Ideonella sp.]|uniref:PAS domain S-box protein n=1 Tax=Ideonella sp. TaxID=1929293 RepID=UPI0035B3EF6D